MAGAADRCHIEDVMHAPRPSPIPVDLLLLAYRNGIFPMADSRDDQEVFWVEPRERAIIPIGGFRCSRSLARAIRRDRFEVTCDADFPGVVEACAAPRADHPESWISRRIIDSYEQLHDAGHAHSIECWENGELVGGVYGVAFDRVFCGESMFSRRRDASKVALGWLLALLERAGCVLFDCQFMTSHLASLGAIEMPQKQYLARLEQARGVQRLTLPQAYSSVLAESAGVADGAGAGAGAGVLAGPGASPDDAGSALRPSPGYLIAQSLTQTS